jgi:hypothetical protein
MKKAARHKERLNTIWPHHHHHHRLRLHHHHHPASRLLRQKINRPNMKKQVASLVLNNNKKLYLPSKSTIATTKAVGVVVEGNKVVDEVVDADVGEEVVVDVCLKPNNNHRQQQLELQEAVQPTMVRRLISDGKIFLLASKRHLNRPKRTGNAQDTRCQ